jgi:AraC family transcriptional regulator
VKPETRSFYELAVLRAAEEVTSALDRALDLEGLARRAALSPFHFHRVFRGMLGETPLELSRRLKLERAAYRLLQDEEPIIELAFGAGYETHESFTRAFRSRYGCSPSEFRASRARDPASTCVGPFRPQLAAQSGIHYQPGAAPLEIQYLKGASIMDVEIKQMPELRVATLRHVGPYNRISRAFERLHQIAGKQQLFGPDSAMLAIFHDDPETTPPSELRSDAGLVVSANASIPGELAEQRLPAGRYARTVHRGPYEQLGDSWSRFMGEWLRTSGQRMVEKGLAYELYRNTPADVPKDELITELYLPLA